MEWIDKNERMPDKHPEYEGYTKDVMVTDGKNWGHGRYYDGMNQWVYVLVGHYEGVDNNITHWAEPPELPKNKLGEL